MKLQGVTPDHICYSTLIAGGYPQRAQRTLDGEGTRPRPVSCLVLASGTQTQAGHQARLSVHRLLALRSSEVKKCILPVQASGSHMQAGHQARPGVYRLQALRSTTSWSGPVATTAR